MRLNSTERFKPAGCRPLRGAIILSDKLEKMNEQKPETWPFVFRVRKEEHLMTVISGRMLLIYGDWLVLGFHLHEVNILARTCP